MYVFPFNASVLGDDSEVHEIPEDKNDGGLDAETTLVSEFDRPGSKNAHYNNRSGKINPV